MTLEFVGPLGVAFAASRRRARPASGRGWRPPGSCSSPQPRRRPRPRSAPRWRCSPAPSGPPTSCSSARIGRGFAGGQGLALAMVVAAGAAAAGRDRRGRRGAARPALLAVGLAVAMLSSAIPYSLELEALRRLPRGTFGVLMSLEPAVAATVGLRRPRPGPGRERGARDRARGRRQRRGAAHRAAAGRGLTAPADSRLRPVSFAALDAPPTDDSARLSPRRPLAIARRLRPRSAREHLPPATTAATGDRGVPRPDACGGRSRRSTSSSRGQHREHGASPPPTTRPNPPTGGDHNPTPRCGRHVLRRAAARSARRSTSEHGAVHRLDQRRSRAADQQAVEDAFDEVFQDGYYQLAVVENPDLDVPVRAQRLGCAAERCDVASTPR